MSQLKILEENLLQEDVNQKLLRSLSPKWNTHVVVWRNKADLDTMRMDDLCNSLKVYEPKVKGMSISRSCTQNMAFVSSSNNNTSSPNGAVNTAQPVNVAHRAEEGPNYALMAFSSSSFDLEVSDNEEKDVSQPKIEKENREMNQFCEMKGILRQFSIARTPQQNRVAERRNMTLIEAVRTMLADFKLPTTFWAEVVSIACYVQNRVLVVKPHNKNPYECFHCRTPNLSFIRPFSKAFRVFNSKTRIVEENLHIMFNESTPNFEGTQSNSFEGTKASDNAYPKSSNDDGSEPSSDDGKKVDEDPRNENKYNDQEKEDNVNSTNNVNTISSTVNTTGTNGVNGVGENISIELQFDPNMPALEDVSTFNFSIDDEDDGVVADMNNLDTTIQMSSMGELTFFLGLQVKQKQDGIFIGQDKYVAKILKKFRFTEVKTASTSIETQKPLLKYENGKEVDVHMYRSMIGSLMYLTFSRPDIMFAVCACARYQVNPKVSHLHAMKRIFRYLKGQPKLGIWYPKDFPFNLVAYTDSDYAGANLDRKSTTRGCQFSRCRLISWQCKKQTVVANSIIKAEYALTVNPTTYISCIELFWSTAMAKTINKEAKLHAKVYGKKIIVSESSVRRDLRLADEEGIGYLLNSTIFEQIALMGKPKRKDTQVPQPSGPTKSVTDEAVYKELGDSLVRASTTASSLEADQDSGYITKTQSKDSLKLDELMELCTNLQNSVLDLEKTKTTQQNEIATQQQEIASLKRRVKKLEKRNRSKTHKLKRLYKVGLSAKVESSGDEESLDDADKEMFNVDDLGGEEMFVAGQNENVVEEVVDAQVSTAATTGTITTEKITLAQALKALKTSKPKGKGIMIEEHVKPKKKEQIRLDEKAAKKLQAEFDKE
nr:uncharacterized mitochondrial protein AtMg00810-like [Tanacetum cinerariifolium]